MWSLFWLLLVCNLLHLARNDYKDFCSVGTFRCNDGRCVALNLRCDGFKQCDDGSDERNCVRLCSKRHFQCSNENCIHASLKCNFVDDCGDASDELGCFEVCVQESHECGDGRCISQWQRCDGIVDCYDLSDERNCTGCNTQNVVAPHASYEDCHQSIQVPPGSFLSIQCHEGYHNTWTSVKTIRCRNNQWESFFGCSPACSTKLLPDNIRILGQPVENVATGDSIIVTCDEPQAYFFTTLYPQTHYTIKCLSSNKWDSTPDCGTLKTLTHMQIYQEIRTLNLTNGDATNIHCQLHSNDSWVNVTSWLWKKGQKDVSQLQKSTTLHPRTEYFVTGNGTLKISNFHSDGQALYSCYAFHNSQLFLGGVAYYVHFTKQRPRNVLIMPELIERGESILISCPVRKKFTQKLAFAWYKNGQPLLGSRSYILVHNGDLLLKDITVADSGEYQFFARIHEDDFNSVYECSHTLHSRASQAFPCLLPNPSPFSWPWLATLWRSEEHSPYCYATLITDRWLITTAFCLLEIHIRSVDDIFVRFQASNGNASRVLDSHTVEQVKIHHDYRFTHDFNLNDIGLIQLREPVTISPICLDGITTTIELSTSQDVCDTDNHNIMNVVGWGQIHRKQLFSEPQAEQMIWKPLHECEIDAKKKTKNAMYCAIRDSATNWTFVADFGAPIFTTYNTDQATLVGLFSWSTLKQKQFQYAFCTRVAKYTSWLTSVVSIN